MEKQHDFQHPALTPEQFYEKLRSLIARLKHDAEWQKLAFFNRYQVSLLDDDFAKMMKPIIGKDLSK